MQEVEGKKQKNNNFWRNKMADGREYTKEDMKIAIKQLCNEVQNLADSERNINMKQFNDYSFMHQLRKMVGIE